MIHPLPRIAPNRRHQVDLPRRQGGVVLFVALIILIVMTLAGIAMLRQITAGVSIAGNLAFKQNATAVADRGIEVGRAWVMSQVPTVLWSDKTESGYFATWAAGFDPSTYDWTGSNKSVTVNLGTENTVSEVRYVVHRLCPKAGQVDDTCVTEPDESGDSKTGRREKGASPPRQAYFRITARALGPRNTVSYTQIMLR
jgi:Tfp pilus assembly protein PilX